MVIYYYFFHPSGNINKTIILQHKRKPEREEDSKPSNNRGRPNMGPISLDMCNKGSDSLDKDNQKVNKISTEIKRGNLERPQELHVNMNDELSSTNRLSATPSLSSPVLDRVDSTNENIANLENQQTLNRSASEPAVTPPLTLTAEDLQYISTHRRLKAMHGKERFISGDRT